MDAVTIDQVNIPVPDVPLTATQRQNVQQWLHELRNSFYNQTTTYLKIEDVDGTKYCCLGIAAEQVLGHEFYRSTTDFDGVCAYGTGAVNMMTDSDAALLGLDRLVTENEFTRLEALTGEHDLGGQYDNGTRQRILAHFNDNGLSFPHIATLITAMGWDRS